MRRETASFMAENVRGDGEQRREGEMIPEELGVEIRRMAHDLSNALEIIVQTSYLLGTTGMKEPAAEWLRMLDGGVEKALGINTRLRAYVKEHSAA